MGLNADANATYSVTTMREDLQEMYISITSTETPFQKAVGRRKAENTYIEWPVVSLAAVDSANRVLEGEASPANNAPTNAVRLGNYCQISDKVAEVTDTAEKVRAPSNTQTMAKQVYFKTKELARDMETLLLDNVAANPGAAATARATAGLPAFLTSNVSRGATGANGTLSGTTAGYPDAAADDGDLRALTEDMLNTVIASCWDNGAEPTLVMCGSLVKRKISKTFTGNATRFKEAEDKKLTAAIDVYISDFGELQIVPNRFQRARDVFVLDPSKARIAFLQTVNQKDLAETGHAKRKLIKAEYALQVDTEAAHGVIADINGAL